jgi:hypothetical protein
MLSIYFGNVTLPMFLILEEPYLSTNELRIGSVCTVNFLINITEIGVLLERKGSTLKVSLWSKISSSYFANTV